MPIQNPDTIKLVDLLKSSSLLDQNSTTVEFSEDDTTCSVDLVWKSRKHKCLSAKNTSTKSVLCNLLAWSIAGSI